MTHSGLLWLVVFFVAALLFFGIALVVGVRGFFDLATLLRGAERHSSGGARDRGSNP